MMQGAGEDETWSEGIRFNADGWRWPKLARSQWFMRGIGRRDSLTLRNELVHVEYSEEVRDMTYIIFTKRCGTGAWGVGGSGRWFLDHSLSFLTTIHGFPNTCLSSFFKTPTRCFEEGGETVHGPFEHGPNA